MNATLRCTLSAALILLGLSSARADPTQILYRFQGADDGLAPVGRLLQGADGALYGVASEGGGHNGRAFGTVFRLAPPADGATNWRFTVLHTFKGAPDGAYPEAGLIADSNGSLYGTTSSGGLQGGSCYVRGCGTAYRLDPPAQPGGEWSETVIFDLDRKTGTSPSSGLFADASGNLYGTAQENGQYDYGAVFRLAPPAAGQTAWSGEAIYSFGGKGATSPTKGVIGDAAGALYGTARALGGGGDHYVGGVVYKLSPPAGASGKWKQTVIYRINRSYDPIDSDLLADTSGALYGTSDAGGIVPNSTGTVFKLSPPNTPGGDWTPTVLHRFDRLGSDDVSLSGLTTDGEGHLYGTLARGNGNSAGGAAYGLSDSLQDGSSDYGVLHVFAGGGNGRGGENPAGPLLWDGNGSLYGVTSQGGGSHEYGTIFQITPVTP